MKRSLVIAFGSAALGDLTESQVLDEPGESPHPPRHGLEHGQRDGRMAPTEVEHGLPWNEHEPRGLDGDGRGDVALAVEERRLAERGAGALGVEHLLPAARRDLAHLHGAVGDDEEAAARIPRFEGPLASPERARAAAPREPCQLGRRDGAEVGNPAQRRQHRIRWRPGHGQTPAVRARGSSISLSASPARLNDSTVKKIAAPGKSGIHQAC